MPIHIADLDKINIPCQLSSRNIKWVQLYSPRQTRIVDLSQVASYATTQNNDMLPINLLLACIRARPNTIRDGEGKHVGSNHAPKPIVGWLLSEWEAFNRENIRRSVINLQCNS
jgi:hypothetical protein